MLEFFNLGRAFPVLIIVLMFCAAAAAVYVGDWRRAGYWFFAGALNVCVAL